jgi:hypothetical protein
MTSSNDGTKKQPHSEDASRATTEAPPKPAALKSKSKPAPGKPMTKAEHAAARRIDKTVIKRMRKR